MTDREKVVKGLEHCIRGSAGCQTQCPYAMVDNCRSVLLEEALELLKEGTYAGIGKSKC